MRPRNAPCSQQYHNLKVLVNEWVMDSRPVHASCDITSKEEKKIPVCHGSQSWSLLAGGYETLWFEIWEAQSSLARWAGWISGKDGGWVQVKKNATTFFCLTWRLLIVSSRVALSSKVVRRGAAVLQKQVLFPDVFQIYYSQPTSN